ncbi:MAG: hypothetical protein M1822_004718 [Bathelium mastoideum]|nr:MAG: hypothetical protein M1822_004718 [Bathelium mastoideum]
MQYQYFNGCTWPTSIDWTAAVLQTYLASSLISISSSTPYNVSSPGSGSLTGQANYTDSLVNRYFDQIVHFYYAQHAEGLTTQKYDDMQWVVLGWLEAIKFINVHSALHYPLASSSNASANFSGQTHVAEFAHRARLFYDLASNGYSTSLCGGGMVWDTTDVPYKNAITNELYVASSVGMYLYFPGDNNPSPSFVVNASSPCTDPTARTIARGANSTAPLPPAKSRDPKYLQNAIKTFVWLTGINMTNSAGLYVDGFHLTNTTCNQRSESLFTYNQGVLLSGIRGLWEATGNASYLNYGHNLIHSTIAATGYNNNSCAALGCKGILADTCDHNATCSQDDQAFKGVYFHHFMLFCAPLPYGSTTTILEQQHAELCGSYEPWVQNNAAAAFSTRNATGDFGGTWASSNGSIDINGLGRGRTVETQGGAVSVFNALYAAMVNSSTSAS